MGPVGPRRSARPCGADCSGVAGRGRGAGVGPTARGRAWARRRAAPAPWSCGKPRRASRGAFARGGEAAQRRGQGAVPRARASEGRAAKPPCRGRAGRRRAEPPLGTGRRATLRGRAGSRDGRRLLAVVPLVGGPRQGHTRATMPSSDSSTSSSPSPVEELKPGERVPEPKARGGR